MIHALSMGSIDLYHVIDFIVMTFYVYILIRDFINYKYPYLKMVCLFSLELSSIISSMLCPPSSDLDFHTNFFSLRLMVAVFFELNHFILSFNFLRFPICLSKSQYFLRY